MTKERYSTGCLKVVSLVFILIHFCATKERYSTGCLNVVSFVFIIINFCVTKERYSGCLKVAISMKINRKLSFAYCSSRTPNMQFLSINILGIFAHMTPTRNTNSYHHHPRPPHTPAAYCTAFDSKFLPSGAFIKCPSWSFQSPPFF